MRTAQILKFVSRAEHLKWREAWKRDDAGSGFHGLPKSELQSSDRTRHIDRLTRGGS